MALEGFENLNNKRLVTAEMTGKRRFRKSPQPPISKRNKLVTLAAQPFFPIDLCQHDKKSYHSNLHSNS